MNPIFSQNDTSVAFSGSSNTDVTGGERFFSPLVFVLVLGGMIFSNDVRANPPNATPLAGASLKYDVACNKIQTIDGLSDGLRIQYPTVTDPYLVPTTAAAKLSFACSDSDAGKSIRDEDMFLKTFCADIDIDIPGGAQYRNPNSPIGCKKSVRWQLKSLFCQASTSRHPSVYKDDVVYDCDASDYTIPDFNMVTLEVQLEPDNFDTRTFYYRVPDHTTQDTPILLNFHGSESEDVLNIDADGIPNSLLSRAAEKYLGAATETSPNYIHAYLTTPSDYKNTSSCT
ncbi:uncharacterized protein METZ01_LOCUS332587, partial [marine metagenome]